MTKILNDRPLFYCFLAFGFGILLAKPIFSLDVLYIAITVLVLGIITYFCIKFKKNFAIMLILLCFLIGLLSFYLSSLAFMAKDFGTEKREISGRVAISTLHEQSSNVILDNVVIDGEKINHCINVYIFGTDGLQEGSIITFSSKIERQTLFTLGEFNSYNYKYNIPYIAYTNLESIVVDSEGSLYWSERLRLNVKNLLFSNMEQDEASVCYASLFGDKTYIDSEIKENFSVSGIAHLLAVSGLHIGFLVTLISMLLKRTRLNKYAKTSILVFILSVYAYLCNFSVSVLRASIMFFILNLSNLLGKRYDRLNAWSLAGICCLSYRPLSVFDGGFLLSFASVLCIFMFAKQLEKKFIKWHLPKALAGTLGVMIPVQFGLVPLLSMYYSKMSILSILTNFICIPIFEIFFMLLFVIVPIVLLLPFLSFLLAVPEFIIGGIIKISNFIANLNFAIINLTAFTGLLVLAIYVIMFCFSHYTNLKTKIKIFTNVFICTFALMAVILQTYTLSPTTNKITILNSSNTIYFLEIDNVSIAFGEFDEYSIDTVQKYSNYSRLYGVDYFISLNASVPDVNKRGDLFKTVYSIENTNPKYNLNDKIKIKNDVLLERVKIINEDFGFFICGKEIKILFLYNKLHSDLEYVEFANNYSNINVVIGKDKYFKRLKDYITYDCFVNGGNILENKSKEKINIIGNWTFSLNNNIITNMRGVD